MADSDDSDCVIVYNNNDMSGEESSEVEYGSDSDYEGVVVEPAAEKDSDSEEMIFESDGDEGEEEKGKSSQESEVQALRRLVAQQAAAIAERDVALAAQGVTVTPVAPVASVTSASSSVAAEEVLVKPKKERARPRPKLILPEITDSDKTRFIKLYERGAKKAQSFTSRKIIRRLKQTKEAGGNAETVKTLEKDLAITKGMEVKTLAEYVLFPRAFAFNIYISLFFRLFFILLNMYIYIYIYVYVVLCLYIQCGDE